MRIVLGIIYEIFAPERRQRYYLSVRFTVIIRTDKKYKIRFCAQTRRGKRIRNIIIYDVAQATAVSTSINRDERRFARGKQKNKEKTY